MITPLGTAATAAQFALALTAVQAPTVPHVPETVVPQVRAASKVASRSSFLPTINDSTIIVTSDNDYSRPTTSCESVIGEIRQWSLLGGNWDGEGSVTPKPQSIREAISFIRMLSGGIELPEPMLLGSGNAALYWNLGGLYADLEFLGDGRIAYFIKNNGDKHKGVLTFDAQKMPAVFPALLKA